MVSPKHLLTLIESSLLGPTPPPPSQKVELLHAIRHSLPSLRSLVSYPPPKPSDRAQVQSKEVRLPDSGPISLDDQDVQIALKLSDDLHLNEIECVRLLISANQEWGLLGRDPLEILRLAAGLWYTERRDLITALYMLLRAVVLDQGLDADLVTDLQIYLEDLINAGVRQRLITLIKELNREEPAGLGGPNCELYILDSRGALVERRAVVSRDRLILTHCLILSVLIVRAIEDMCLRYPNATAVNVYGAGAQAIHSLAVKEIYSLRNLEALTLGRGQLGETFFQVLPECHMLKSLAINDATLGNGIQEIPIYHERLRRLQLLSGVPCLKLCP